MKLQKIMNMEDEKKTDLKKFVFSNVKKKVEEQDIFFSNQVLDFSEYMIIINQENVAKAKLFQVQVNFSKTNFLP